MSSELIERFRALHRGPLLMLPNAWDALSARLFEEAGARAVATSSAVLAWAHGYADGEKLPLERLLGSVREIASKLRVPTSVDLERGYAREPERVAEAVSAVLDAGAVGVNLEDGAEAAEHLADKLRAVRARLGPRVFLNARTCVVLHGKVSGEAAVREVLERARLFEQAGADGLFVPLLHDPNAIAAVARGTRLPLNVMALPGLPPPAALAKRGAQRLSAATRLGSLAYGAAARTARAWLEQVGTAALDRAEHLDYFQTNALWKR